MEKTFEIVSGKVVLSDPCYELGTWCQGVIDNVKNGTWIAEIEKSSEGRVSRLFAYHKDEHLDGYIIETNGEHLKFDGGVDSGQFGFFDYDRYRDDNSIIGVERLCKDLFDIICENQPFYSICCDRTLCSEMWGVIPFGVISSSGYGDGSYPVFGLKNHKDEYVGFSVVFIDETEKDFDDGYDIYDDYESGNIPYDENEQDFDDPDENISELDISDDLKSNFRSWEFDHNNERDAYALSNILTSRHPDIPFEKIQEIAYEWVGYYPNEEGIDVEDPTSEAPLPDEI